MKAYLCNVLLFYTVVHTSWKLQVMKNKSGQVLLIFSGFPYIYTIYHVYTIEYFFGGDIDEYAEVYHSCK